MDYQEYDSELSVTFTFKEKKPGFGDLFEIVGYTNPNFPPSGNFKFGEMDALQFSQVDDYFGVQTISEVGEDVCIWLFPLLGGEIVDHHPGPFTGIKVTYNVLKNPVSRSDHFLKVIKTLEEKLDIPPSERLETLGSKIHDIVKYWKLKGIEPGSDSAMEIED